MEHCRCALHPPLLPCEHIHMTGCRFADSWLSAEQTYGASTDSELLARHRVYSATMPRAAPINFCVCSLVGARSVGSHKPRVASYVSGGAFARSLGSGVK